MKKNEKISVFGGTGFIGSAFCELYGDYVVSVDREQRDPPTENVLYLISTTDNYNVLTDSFVDIDTNLRILMETLDACRERGTDVINFISSWFVYGDTSLPAREDSPCNPKGFYSITKRCAEQLLISYCETFGMNYRILRLCNVFGSTDPKVTKKRNALQFLINRLKHDEEIFLYDGGEFFRNFMHVTDTCRAIKLVCDKGQQNQIYNIGSVNNYKFKDIIEIAAIEINSKSKIGSMEVPTFHKTVQVKDMLLDTTRLYALGFTESISIEEGIRLLCRT